MNEIEIEPIEPLLPGWGFLNFLGTEIHQINVDHGFAEPLPKLVVDKAEEALDSIRDIVESFEALRKDPDFDPGVDYMVDVSFGGYGKVKLLLVISEIIETIDSITIEDHNEEVADIFIRLLDYAHTAEVNVDEEIASKIEKNRNRSYLHGHNF